MSKRATYEPEPGLHIATVTEAAVKIAKAQRVPVHFAFNGIDVIARPWDRPDEVERRYKEAYAERAARK